MDSIFFDQDDYEVFLRKGRIIATLRNAIVNHYDGFEVYYQPIVDCQSEQIIGAEALMRFSMITEEGREFVSPMEFIPLLEETGLIIPAGGYILNEAAAMCCEMQKYIPDFRMNVNVSYVQILQGNVERDILDAIQKYSLQTECLCVEMTESGFMDMTPSFCKFRKTLDKNGIPFVIDDFGTGYSNLHCIRDMNPSYVKMDRDFTAKAMNSDRDYELYKNIIPMVHCINVRICAEGIEEISAIGGEAHALSGGEERRLDLARTLWRQGSLVMLDEPTAGLDEKNARRAGKADRAASMRHPDRRHAQLFPGVFRQLHQGAPHPGRRTGTVNHRSMIEQNKRRNHHAFYLQNQRHLLAADPV